MSHLLSYTSSQLQIDASTNLFTRSDRIAEFFQGAVVYEPSGIAVSVSYRSSVKIMLLGDATKGGGGRRTKGVEEFDAR